MLSFASSSRLLEWGLERLTSQPFSDEFSVEQSVSSGSTRLVECSINGCRLEVKHEDQWGTVCSAGFKDVNAKVVCRSLGLPGGKVISSYGGRYNKQGFRNVWMSNVKCNGEESWIGSCRYMHRGQIAVLPIEYSHYEVQFGLGWSLRSQAQGGSVLLENLMAYVCVLGRHDAWKENTCSHDDDVGICCERAWPELK